MKDTEIKVNIGQMAGTKTGQRFMVIDLDVILQITSVQKETSLAKILKGAGPMREGLPIEVMYSE